LTEKSEKEARLSELETTIELQNKSTEVISNQLVQSELAVEKLKFELGEEKLRYSTLNSLHQAEIEKGKGEVERIKIETQLLQDSLSRAESGEAKTLSEFASTVQHNEKLEEMVKLQEIELQAAKNNMKELDELKAAYNVILFEREEHKATISELHKITEKQEENAAKCIAQSKELERLQIKLDQEKKDWSILRTQHQNEIDIGKKRVEILEEKLGLAEEEQRKMLSDLTIAIQKKDDLETKLKSQETELQETINKAKALDTLETSYNTIVSEKEAYKAKILQLERTVELQKESDENTEKSVAQSKEQIQRLQFDLDEEKKRFSSLSSQLEIHVEKSKKEEDLQGRLSLSEEGQRKVMSGLAIAVQQKEDLERVVESREMVLQAAINKVEELDRLKTAYNTVISEKEAYKEAILRLERIVAQQKDDCEKNNWSNLTTRLQNEIESGKKESEILKEKLACAEEGEKKTQSKLDKAIGQIAKLSVDLEKYSQKLLISQKKSEKRKTESTTENKVCKLVHSRTSKELIEERLLTNS
jgi:uncharacterized coiled-coil protein SlyX